MTPFAKYKQGAPERPGEVLLEARLSPKLAALICAFPEI